MAVARLLPIARKGYCPLPGSRAELPVFLLFPIVQISVDTHEAGGRATGHLKLIDQRLCGGPHRVRTRRTGARSQSRLLQMVLVQSRVRDAPLPKNVPDAVVAQLPMKVLITATAASARKRGLAKVFMTAAPH